ncbi:MAG: 4Fe-4S binding protein [Desulfovibrionaceae bacterium]
MIVKREIIRIDEALCDGCGLCVPSCAEGAIQIVDGKARVVADKYCDGLGACLGHCPQGALSIEVREAEDFDEEAVEELLASQGRPSAKAAQGHVPTPSHGGCPSGKLMPLTPCEKANVPSNKAVLGSSLTHWPVQIRLVPPDAPFLKNADLLLTADCVAVALPDYHAAWLPGKVVLMGCPKFDDAEMYIDRLATLFAVNDLKSLTVLEMEVPCCANMGRITHEAVRRSGKSISFERVVVARQGQILVREHVSI